MNERKSRATSEGKGEQDCAKERERERERTVRRREAQEESLGSAQEFIPAVLHHVGVEHRKETTTRITMKRHARMKTEEKEEDTRTRSAGAIGVEIAIVLDGNRPESRLCRLR